MEKPPNLFKSKTLTKKKALPEAFRDSFKQSVSDIDERRTDDSIGSHDSLTWSNENQCLKTQFENTEPAEMFGIGANRCVNRCNTRFRNNFNVWLYLGIFRHEQIKR